MADEQAPPPPGEVMSQMIAGFWVSRTIYAAATLGLADLVKDGPMAAASRLPKPASAGLGDGARRGENRPDT